MAAEGKWSFGAFELDSVRYELRRNGRPLRIERIPMDLLILLLAREGQLVSRQDIVDQLWGPGIHLDSEQGINTAVRKLRQTLRDDPENPKFIQTVVGKGYRFIGEVAVQNGAPPTAQPQAPEAAKSERTYPAWFVAGAAAAVMLILTVVKLVSGRPTLPEAMPLRASLLPPENVSFFMHVLSPDGRRLVFQTQYLKGLDPLWLRSLDELEAHPLPGTEGAISEFWSPDGRYIGFFQAGRLKKIDLRGGPPVDLAAAPFGLGGTWSQDGTIVFPPTFNDPHLYKIPATGGQPAPILTADKSRGETNFLWPHFLPDGRHFLYSVFKTSYAAEFGVASLDSAEHKILGQTDSEVLYSRGHILYTRDRALLAQPFDLKRLVLTGDPVMLVKPVQNADRYLLGLFSVSESGPLLYLAGQDAESGSLIWFDRSGRKLSTVEDDAGFGQMHLSPERQKLVVAISAARDHQLWVYDLARGVRTSLTTDAVVDGPVVPIWSPDAKSIAFTSLRNESRDLYKRSADGSGPAELLYTDALSKNPTSWSPDGKHILYWTKTQPETGEDVWILSEDRAAGSDQIVRKAAPFMRTRFDESRGQFSPRGRWVAYESNESGKFEVYAAPFHGPGGKCQISVSGGTLARWGRDEKEIFYVAPDGRLMATEIDAQGDTLKVGSTHALFGSIVRGRGFSYDVSADGQRILAFVPAPQQFQPLTLLENWVTLLKK